MQLSTLAWLSESQNRIFGRRLQTACDELGLDLTEAPDPDQADLVYLCGLPASRMLRTHRPLLAPVLAAPRYQGQPWYFVDVVARDADLGLGAGRWAYNQPDSFSGWLAVRHGLRLHHLDPDAIEWIATGSHAASLDAIRTEAADQAGIDSMILDLDSATVSRLVVLDSWGPWPTPPVMVSRRLDHGFVRDLSETVLGTDRDVNWVAIDPGHLDPISAVAQPALGPTEQIRSTPTSC
ncbi:MAG: PhnD/SsuA/transferrin family substrate-binding protein [Acidimicrobiia bacterium]